MYTFIISILLIISGLASSIGEHKTSSIEVDTITPQSYFYNDINVTIEKQKEGVFNMMIMTSVPGNGTDKPQVKSEEFEKMLVVLFQDNEYITFNTPSVETFRDCNDAASGNIAPIKTVRNNTMITLTEKGKKAGAFELKGTITCTMQDYCLGNDTYFNIAYKNGEMKVITSYPTMIYQSTTH